MNLPAPPGDARTIHVLKGFSAALSCPTLARETVVIAGRLRLGAFRRPHLKIRCPKGLTGSSPVPGTMGGAASSASFNRPARSWTRGLALDGDLA